MNGYIEGGYSICLATLTIYAATLLRRERSFRRRLPERPSRSAAPGRPGGGPDIAGLGSAVAAKPAPPRARAAERAGDEADMGGV
jgi:hypothetical protein